MIETFPPLGDDPPWNVKELGDVLVIEARSSQEDDLGSNHLVMGHSVFRGVLNESLLLCTGKRDYEGALARHFAFLLSGVAKYRVTRLKSRQNVRPYLRKGVPRGRQEITVTS